MDKDYWNSYYAARKAIHYPSPFCEYCCSEWIPPRSTILELGCGNGRDAFYFAEKGNDVVGLDQADLVIEDNVSRSSEYKTGGKLSFLVEDFANPSEEVLDSKTKANIVYSRFTIHSVSDEDQNAVINWVHRYLPDGGMFLIECRTLNDPMIEQGRRISDSEAVTDHYRRFIDPNMFLKQAIERGFRVRYFLESHGLAVFGDEDPVVARFVLQK